MSDDFRPSTRDMQDDVQETPDGFEEILTPESAEADAPVNRPEILVEPGRLPELATAGEVALIAAGAEVFQRGGALVRPASFAVRASGGREAVAVGLRQLTPAAMIDRLARAAIWQRPAKKDGPRIIDPPAQIATIILNRAGDWHFPSLAGVVAAPCLRRDGTLLTAPGYDPESRMFLAVASDFRMPAIQDDPTKADAKAALGELDALLSGFPFVTDIDRSVALSMLMTPVLRPAMDAAPFHFAVAPAPGSGKSFLIDLASAIATGQICPVSNVSRNPEELEKNLTGLLLDGFPVISLDNVENEVGGSLLCQATERPMIRLRPLGTSQIATIENATTIFGTGNNAVVTGDMVRRALPCHLDAGVERPELRHFDSNPLAMALDNRGVYVSAILRIARAYRCAGSPNLPRPVASYGDWNALVRGPLIWLGCPDPADAMESARADDPQLATLATFLAAFALLPQASEGVPAKAIITAAEERIATIHGEPAELAWPELAEALEPIATVKGRLDGRRLGYFLRANAGRVLNGRKLVVRSGHESTSIWGVRPA